MDVAIPGLIQLYQQYQAGQRLARNRESGLTFQAKVLESLELPQNYQKVSGTYIQNTVKQVGKSIPDALTDSVMVEVKNTASVYNTSQIQIQVNAAQHLGLQYKLIVNQATHVAETVRRAIEKAGGVIERFPW